MIDSLLEKIIKLNPVLNNLLFCVNADFDNHDICQSCATYPQKDIISYNSKKNIAKIFLQSAIMSFVIYIVAL